MTLFDGSKQSFKSLKATVLHLMIDAHWLPFGDSVFALEAEAYRTRVR